MADVYDVICSSEGNSTAAATKSEKEVSQEIASVMKQIVACVSFLPLLDAPCMYKLRHFILLLACCWLIFVKMTISYSYLKSCYVYACSLTPVRKVFYSSLLFLYKERLSCGRSIRKCHKSNFRMKYILPLVA